MAKKSVHPVKASRARRTIPWALALVVLVVVILLPVGGFAFAATQESHDAFCGSCHTQPESTYLARATAAKPVDLASYHTAEATRCIDCHSGAGLGGRLQAEMLGAGNAFKWYSGTAAQPAPLTNPIRDDHCLKCHPNITDRNYVPNNQALQDLGEAENGHWHFFLKRWQAQAASAGACVSCHSSHATEGDAQILYLNQQTTGAVCDACHRTLGED